MIEFLSQILNGIVIGNIYALIAIGFSLIFGVANLINFAQGSLLMLGAYFAYAGLQLGAPLWLAAGAALVMTAAAGALIERLALRPLASAPWIAPLLSTLALTFIIDQAAELIWSPEPQPFPSPLAAHSWVVGAAYVTGVDVAILVLSWLAMGALWLFLSRTWSGRALRAMSQDFDAAKQMGVQVDRLRQLAFALAGGLAALAGLMAAMYYQNIYPQMGIPFGLKGFIAALLGGLTSIPGALLGGVLLGILESVAVGYAGEGFRDMIAYSALLLILLLRPQGLLGHSRLEALGGSFGASGIMPSTSIVMGQSGNIVSGRVFNPPYGVLALALSALALLPWLGLSDYIIQIVLLAIIFAILAVGLTVLSGSAGVMFLGFAGLFGVGAYLAALGAKGWGWSAEATILMAASATAATAVLLGTTCIRLTGHVVSLATIALGMLIWLVLLNWVGITGGPSGIFAIPRPLLALAGGLSMSSIRAQYWQGVVVLVLVVAVAGRLLGSPMGRGWRAIREDRPAAHAAGLPVTQNLLSAFAFAGFCAGAAGAMYAFLQRYISPDSFRLDTSFLLVASVVLGGMGNLAGAVLAGATLALLPEVLRDVAGLRMIVFGLILFVAMRWRPQGLAGIN
jgi:branched-chain amino acid transport system permease protein